MTRKRTKNLIDLGLSKSISKDVTPTPNDSLPPYERYFYCKDDDRSLKVWFVKPTPNELETRRARNETAEHKNVGRNEPIVPWMVEKGFSEFFGQQVSRLIIHAYEGTEVSNTFISSIFIALKSFFPIVSEERNQCIGNINIDDISDDDFIAFRDWLLNSSTWAIPTISSRFGAIKKLFSHKSVRNHKQIQLVKSTFKKKKNGSNPSPDLTSPLYAVNTYSESVMFQFLCYFIYDFERHIEWLKEYENLTEQDVLDITGGKIVRHVKEPFDKKTSMANRKLVNEWLSDEKYYPILVKHELLWRKLWSLNFYAKSIMYRADRHKPKYKEIVSKYNNWVNDVYAIPGVGVSDGTCTFRPDIPSIYDKELLSSAKGHGSTAIKHRTSYCLVNLVLMATGINLEVVLSWNSTVDGKSILDHDDTLFRRNDGVSSPQSVVTGVKKKMGGRKSSKEIKTTIPKSSPLYRMLKQYEKHIKTDFDGKFFEFMQSFRQRWNFVGPKNRRIKLSEIYPIAHDDGTLIESLETRKFRKVFGKKKLFELMSDVQSPIELAEKIQEAFDHENLDTTLSYYLMKEKDARSAIDLAIVKITESKLNELSFAGRVDISGKVKGVKEVFLCECEDPSNPSHEFSIADECRKYDLCLGCHRSIISAKHLPYICGRILQYEELRTNMTKWSAFIEDRWLIAHDALKQYELNDRVSGKQLVMEAWQVARSEGISLPPIIMPEVA